MIQQNERNKEEIGEYVVFLVESGYAAWDESVGAYVFAEGLDTTKIMKDFLKKKKKEKHESFS
jgi:hypothetical protein